MVKESDDKLCLEDLKAKLMRMGTNVSIASSDSKNEVRNIAGVSSIKREEFIRSPPSKGELKNSLEEDKKVKPSCAVKPMLKGPKPSATVKPFIKTEGLLEEVKGEDLKVAGDAAPVSGTASAVAAVLAGTPQNLSGSGSGCVSESRSSSRSSSLDSDPSAETETSASSETVESRETSGGEMDTVSPLPPYQQPGEDDFNADIVCPHGNLRIEQKHRQLISREAWHRLNSYFTKPITFQFGTPNCSICEDEHNEANLLKERWREEAAKQKAKLPDLFKDIERPKWSKPSTTRVYLLNSGFVMVSCILVVLAGR